ncbi:Obg family GTPase CgtA [Candidatus Curtissbacteria bacterium RBG_16_39_7]|uniref:Obg family GTPase CgtA n=1 Tax=Candidatus Curtissbacteria bacterium RBG_16_39_7 TaxID=1797707 RepID=A0A1F5G1M9_9BACT|nr:MAG: Obg family GTPase CgtA [Candidatus Curtissbacteria bacterium RBG_16_39_7]
MFVDEVEVFFKAGDGAPGKASFYPGFTSGPDGGNGGNGGHIYLTVTSDLTALNQFLGVKTRKAENGRPGRKLKKSGKNGKSITITLPLGCILTDEGTGEVIELNDIRQKVLICQGGHGGKGTYDLRSPSNTTPLKAEPGEPGQKRNLKIILKLIADYGLIGLPNAGKSSLLNELTSANVKVADYPFTTLEPNLGVMGKKVLADIPGLIEGASAGKGLGISFLKHIEKVNLLLHCLSAESQEVETDYQVVREELKKFNSLLTQKPEIILLTKTDIVSEDGLEEKQKILQKYGRVLPISILDNKSLEKLKKLLK